MLATTAPIDADKIHGLIADALNSPEQIRFFYGSDAPRSATAKEIYSFDLVRLIEALKTRSVQESAAGKPEKALRMVSLIVELSQKVANLNPPESVPVSELPNHATVPGYYAEQNAISVVKVGLEDVGRGLNGLPKPLRAKFSATHHVIDLLGTDINALQKQQGILLKKAGGLFFLKKPSEYSLSEREQTKQLAALVAREMSVLRSGMTKLNATFASEARSSKAARPHTEANVGR